jgi:hypothetical protein
MSTSKAFELLHIDLFGPTQYTSIGGNKYGFVIVDDYTRYTWVLFLVDKSDVFATFKSFVKGIHNEFEMIIKRVKSDNDSEFKNTRIDELCDDFGIRHQFSAKYTPQSNGPIERKNRTLIDMVRSMLSEYNVSQSFWAETINMACYYSNHLYCHPLKEKTPYELLNRRKPNIAYFWVFGCKCYIFKKGTRLGKFEKKCNEGFLLGYSTTSKAYRIWNLASDTLEEVHDIEFDKTKSSQDENKNLDDVRGIQLSNAMKNMDVGELRPRQVNDEEDDQVQVLSNSNIQVDTNQASTNGSHDNVQDQVASTLSQPNEQASASNQVPILQATNIIRDHPLDTIIRDIFRGVQIRSRLALFYEHFSFVSFIEPKKIEEALRDADWVNAMHEELNSSTRNQV